ncbi:MAG: M42 family metallopeptidase [Actinomycetota bacterium]
MQLDGELLKRLLSTPGVSGREERIREVVEKELTGLVDEVRTDRLGSLLGVRKGGAPRLMLCAHMDSIGFLVRHIDDDGYLRISPVGGFDTRTLVMQRVLVTGKNDYVGLLAPATKPIHLLKKEEREKTPKIEEFFVDLMLPADEVKQNISIGDPVTLLREPIVTDRAVTAPYLDDRLGVYVLLEALRRMRGTGVEVDAVISVQEEVGVRGAATSAFGIEPDIGIALDITVAADLPGSASSDQVTVLGKGASIGVMDSLSISDPRLVRTFRELAERDGIEHQLEVALGGGTDAGAMQLSRAGVPVITISTPVRYVHTANEMALASDIDATVMLVARFLESVADVDLEWR